MKKILLVLKSIEIFVLFDLAHSQNSELNLVGLMLIGNHDDNNPQLGSIRWSLENLPVCNGEIRFPFPQYLIPLCLQTLYFRQYLSIQFGWKNSENSEI